MKKFFDLKPYLTYLSRHKLYTAINIFGFSVSLMFVILIGLYVEQEYSVDAMHSKADRICLIASAEDDADPRPYTGSNYGFMRYLASRYPEIEKMCTVVKQEEQPITKPTGEVIRSTFLYTDSTFFQLFDFPLIKGDRNHVLDQSNDAVISERLARKLFGDLDPMGRSFVFYDSLKVRVSGVMGSMKGSSLPEADVVTRFEFMRYVNINIYQMNNFGSADVFVMTKPGATLANKEKDLTEYFKTFAFVYQAPGSKVQARVIPFKGSYFSKTVSNVCERGDSMLVNVLFVFGVVVLLFSVMNYVNLTVAQSSRRAREMATRRLFGAQRGAVVMQLIGESIALCVMSLIIGIILAVAFAPVFGKLLSTEISFKFLLSPIGILLLMAFVLLTGILAGLLPSAVISRAKPIDVVRGTFRHSTRMRLGKLSISFQNVLTIIMVSVSLTMVMQVRHWINAPLGWQRAGIVQVPNPGDSVKAVTFLNELKKLSCIDLVSSCFCTPLQGGFNNTTIYNGRTFRLQRFSGDENFMKILGIEVEREYAQANGDGVYVNKGLFAAAGLPETAKSFLEYGDGHPESRVPIRGILKGVKLGVISSTENEDCGVMFSIHKGVNRYTDASFLVKLNGNLTKSYEQVRAVYKSVYNEALDLNTPFIDQQVELVYEAQSRLSTIMSLFAGVALLISLLGLIAMPTYYTEQHRREIAVRKVFGSTAGQVRRRFVSMFLFYVAIAIVVAAPVAWFIASQWQATYTYRISPLPCIAVACAFCLLTAYIAMLVQCGNAANENPINHIKDE